MSDISTESRTHAKRWDNFAKIDAQTYICTGLKKQDHQAFWQSGETIVDRELLPMIKQHNVPTGIGLDLGCGEGRLSIPLAQHFSEVIGVDISSEMVRRAEKNAQERCIQNTRFLALSEPAELIKKTSQFLGKVNFVFSLLVFQHIQDFHEIESYVLQIHELLSDDGIAYLQFDTRSSNLFYRVRNILPDLLLPRFWRKSIRRIRRKSSVLSAYFDKVGLRVIQEKSPRTNYHVYVLKRMNPITRSIHPH